MPRICIVQNKGVGFNRTPQGWVTYQIGPNHGQKTPTTWDVVRKAMTASATIIKEPTTAELLAAADAARDLDVFHVSAVRARANRSDARKEYRNASTSKTFEDWCSDNDITGLKVGWYYAFGQPGCLYDSTPSGPYPSERAAKLAAVEDHDLPVPGQED